MASVNRRKRFGRMLVPVEEAQEFGPDDLIADDLIDEQEQGDLEEALEGNRDGRAQDGARVIKAGVESRGPPASLLAPLPEVGQNAQPRAPPASRGLTELPPRPKLLLPLHHQCHSQVLMCGEQECIHFPFVGLQKVFTVDKSASVTALRMSCVNALYSFLQLLVDLGCADLARICTRGSTDALRSLVDSFERKKGMPLTQYEQRLRATLILEFHNKLKPEDQGRLLISTTTKPDCRMVGLYFNGLELKVDVESVLTNHKVASCEEVTWCDRAAGCPFLPQPLYHASVGLNGEEFGELLRTGELPVRRQPCLCEGGVRSTTKVTSAFGFFVVFKGKEAMANERYTQLVTSAGDQVFSKDAQLLTKARVVLEIPDECQLHGQDFERAGFIFTENFSVENEKGEQEPSHMISGNIDRQGRAILYDDTFPGKDPTVANFTFQVNVVAFIPRGSRKELIKAGASATGPAATAPAPPHPC